MYKKKPPTPPRPDGGSRDGKVVSMDAYLTGRWQKVLVAALRGGEGPSPADIHGKLPPARLGRFFGSLSKMNAPDGMRLTALEVKARLAPMRARLGLPEPRPKPRLALVKPRKE